jgi:aspartyl-tRNA(Asn)/glutamyl-tRNA(Gln) amidotransferase subunit A
VAVAAGLCYVTVDTDAIGSGRLPAAVCGVTCHKPTFGLLSPVGILAGEPTDPAILTLGHPCVMARTAEDVALALHAIVMASTDGHTLEDAVGPSFQNRRVGIVTNYVADGAVQTQFAIARDTLASMGVTLTDVEVPFEAATFDLHRVERDRVAIDASLFGEVSAIILPTLAARVPTVDEARAQGDMAVSPRNTFFCNYFGLPAVSVPSGLDETGMPAAVQIVGPHGADSAILALAREFERVSGWRSEPPPLGRLAHETRARWSATLPHGFLLL